MAVATLSHGERHLIHNLPGLGAATASHIHHDPHSGRWQPLDHGLAHQLPHKPHSSHAPRRRRLRRSRQRLPLQCLDDARDGRDLAADPAVALPGDGAGRSKNHIPRLEREEAFRAPKWLGAGKSSSWPLTDFVEDDADLYRLGLLYDDEHARGSGFGLDALVSAEPVYSVRPAKRVRRGRGDKRQRVEDAWELCFEFEQEVLAPDVRELPDLAREESRESRAGREQNGVSSLSVIHELPEDSSTHSLEPKVLMDTEGPSLLSDSDDGGEWALLDKTETETLSVLTDAEVDVRTDADDGAMSAAGGPWIMLGDGS